MNPWETGSYDLALEMAKIENFNVVPYTSCIPAEANEVKVEDVRHVFHHGAVLEVIQAVMCAPCAGVPSPMGGPYPTPRRWSRG